MNKETAIEQKHIDHFWQQFQNGRATGDHAEKTVFDETLRSFARWYADRVNARDVTHT